MSEEENFNLDNVISGEKKIQYVDNLFKKHSGKKIKTFGITSKKINEFKVGEVAIFKDKSTVTVNEDGLYILKSENEFTKKKGRRLFITEIGRAHV